MPSPSHDSARSPGSRQGHSAAASRPPGASDIEIVLRRAGLLQLGEEVPLRPLTGGVSSDIWRADTRDGPVCVKRALAKLKVAADWRAPVERNAFEAAWMETARRLVPEAVPELLHRDPPAGALVMRYLDERDHPVWKEVLRSGRVEPDFAAAVGAALVAIHGGTADDATVAERFRTDRIFYDIRLEPYLVATAQKHPDLQPQLNALVARTAETRRSLVHGDVSPKNILVGPQGPVFSTRNARGGAIPPSDLAFCLNHLLLKAFLRRDRLGELVASFEALAGAYLEGVLWEPRIDVEMRAATLLPGLLLARIDGKSPVEYVTTPADKELVREVARWFLRDPTGELTVIARSWAEALGAGGA